MSTWTNEKHERSQVLAGWLTSPGNDTREMLGEALVEINRLRALTTITDDMVERLAIYQNDTHLTTWQFPWRRLSEDEKKALRAEARWGLEAALNPPT